MKKLTLLFLCSWQLAFAQAPGYMGKKTSVGYGVFVSPVLIPGVSGASDNMFNVLHDFFIERMLKKKFAGGFSIKYYKTLYDNSAPVQVPNAYGGYSSLYGYHPEGNYEITGLNYGIYGKLFYGRYLAPLGKYFTFGLNIKKINTTYNPNYMKIRVVEPSYYYPYTSTTHVITNFGQRQQSFTDVDLMAGIGHTRVFADKIIVDYGYQANLIALTGTLLDVGGDLTFERTTSNYIEKTSKQRVRGVNRFNLFLKIGILF